MRILKRILLALPGFQALCRRLTSGVPRVLMYHRFRADDEDRPRSLPAAVLDRQLAYLARHHRRWRSADLLAHLAGETPPPDGCPVLLTIDDGYADVGAVAAPLLSRHGWSALLFVTTGFLDGTTWFWWDRLRWLLETTSPATVTLGNRTFHAGGSGPAAVARLWNDLADALQPLPTGEREARLAELSRSLGADIPAHPPSVFAPLTWERLRELLDAPLEVGAHTVTHPILAREDDATIRRELAESKRRLEERTGRSVPLFCYPSGMPADIDERVVKLAAAAGFRAAFVAHPGGDPADPYRQPRHAAPADWTEFRWLLCGAGLLVERLRRRTGQRKDAP